jgi:light-harvesting complex I chlorophyll a/b binding protein 3
VRAQGTDLAKVRRGGRCARDRALMRRLEAIAGARRAPRAPPGRTPRAALSPAPPPLTPPSPPQVERVQKAGGLYLNFASDQSLGYLNGALPGDFGFDPLGLSDPEGAGGFVDPSWLAYSEVIHGRWAMLGAAGCLAPEVLAAAGVIPQGAAESVWFRSGVIPPAGAGPSYWADPYTLFWGEVILMQFAELKRWQDYKNPGSQSKQYFLGMEAAFQGSGNPAYPGGQFFNMFNFGKTEAGMNELKLKEIKNGRLAMLACFGFGAQAVMTHAGPFANLSTHLSDPAAHNLLTNLATVMRN